LANGDGLPVQVQQVIQDQQQRINLYYETNQGLRSSVEDLRRKNSQIFGSFTRLQEANKKLADRLQEANKKLADDPLHQRLSNANKELTDANASANITIQRLSEANGRLGQRIIDLQAEQAALTMKNKRLHAQNHHLAMNSQDLEKEYKRLKKDFEKENKRLKENLEKEIKRLRAIIDAENPEAAEEVDLSWEGVQKMFATHFTLD